jgi:uncharacterized membrane protein
MTLAAAVAAIGAIYADMQSTNYIEKNLTWLTATPDSARAGLGAIAGAMVTVAGVVLSITVVALSMTSSQYGPRLIRSFMEQPATQIALGAFVATSLYCFLVLRAVRGGEDDVSFVPHLAVLLSLAMAIVSVGILIYFIHEVAVLVQAPHVVKSVSDDLDAAIERMFPQRLGEPVPAVLARGEVPMQLAALGDQFTSIAADVEGYLQAIDTDGLMHRAVADDAVIQLLVRPGDFIVRGAGLARVWSAHPLREHFGEKLNGLLIVGNRRTPRQDVECAVVEMVEVAVRALSPGVNDPFTAITCVDRLAASLTRLARRSAPSPLRHDKDGRLRVIARGVEFPGVLNAAFDQIRQNARGNVAVSARLLEGLHLIAQEAFERDQQECVRRQAEMILRASDEAIAEVNDRDDIRERAEKVFHVLDRHNKQEVSEYAS